MRKLTSLLSCLVLMSGMAVAFATPAPKTIKPITPVIAEAPMPFCRVITPNCPF